MPDQERVVDPEPAHIAMIARVGVQRLFLRGEGVEQREGRLAVDVLVIPREQELDRDGDRLEYSTYLGGSDDDSGNGIAVDGSGNAYVTGGSLSSNFPTTPGAFQTTFGGGRSTAFVSKLNIAGSALLYSTYLGGSDDDDDDASSGGNGGGGLFSIRPSWFSRRRCSVGSPTWRGTRPL